MNSNMNAISIALLVQHQIYNQNFHRLAHHTLLDAIPLDTNIPLDTMGITLDTMSMPLNIVNKCPDF